MISRTDKDPDQTPHTAACDLCFLWHIYCINLPKKFVMSSEIKVCHMFVQSVLFQISTNDHMRKKDNHIVSYIVS